MDKSDKFESDESESVALGPSHTPDQFCALEEMSKASLYLMWQQGIGPDYYVVGRKSRRITEPARRKWQRERIAAEKVKRAKREAEKAERVAATSSQAA
jgi:hypothetical protein